MHYHPLPTTDLSISSICLGTMSYDDQVMEKDAHAQLDLALDLGVNFIDTAEIYAIPVQAKTCGATEEIIGRWLEKSGKRKNIILATKVAGPGRYPFIRDGQTRLDRKNIEVALEESLRRLKTDYIDLYQLHWPDRHVNSFGRRGFEPVTDEKSTPIEETLGILEDLRKTGKVRHFGLSNETAWGVMEFLRIAREKNLPRMITVQNPYNLLNRTYEINLAEVSHREDIGLLAYSPLGYGVLGGRYLEGGKPSGGRFTLHPNFAARYCTPEVQRVTAEYVALAREHNLSPAQMALAFVRTRPFVTSTIIGASTVEQLKEDIESVDLELDAEVLEGIERIHKMHPDPCC